MKDMKENSFAEEYTNSNYSKYGNYEKKSLKLNNDGENFLYPSTVDYLTQEHLSPIYTLFTNMRGDNLGTNVVLEIGNFQSVWREEMEEIRSTSTNPLAKVHIEMKELIASPFVSRRALNVSTLNLKEYIRKNVLVSFTQQIDKALLFGDGIKEPKGILRYMEDKTKDNKPVITSLALSKDKLLASLLEMENRLPSIYKKQAIWLMSRSLHQMIQHSFYNQKENHFVINRDDINYRLFNRKLYICDELDGDKNTHKINCILVHPMAYTTIENDQVEVIENNLEVDMKLIFIKYFGGALTDSKALILGSL